MKKNSLLFKAKQNEPVRLESRIQASSLKRLVTTSLNLNDSGKLVREPFRFVESDPKLKTEKGSEKNGIAKGWETDSKRIQKFEKYRKITNEWSFLFLSFLGFQLWFRGITIRLFIPQDIKKRMLNYRLLWPLIYFGKRLSSFLSKSCLVVKRVPRSLQTPNMMILCFFFFLWARLSVGQTAVFYEKPGKLHFNANIRALVLLILDARM